MLIGVPPAQKFSRLDQGGGSSFCGLPGRDSDVVIREEVLPRFWQTI